MQTRKLGFEASLEKNVVLTRRCVGCATCVVVCPFNCLEYNEGQPRLVKECETCGICPQVCPEYDWLWSKAEEFVFGRQRKENEEFGIYRRLVLAQATDKKILEHCQDGGVVTAILTYALQNSIVEGVALSGLAENKPLYPLPKLATTPKEVLENAGTRYSYSPNMLALQEGVKQRKKSLAFVGTPCQIHAIRKIQMFPLKKYSNPLQFTVGLMCTESFTYDGLFEKHLKKNMDLNLNDFEKMNIKGKVLISLKSGEVKSVSLSEAKQYTRESCRLCNDFSAELADISVGGLGLSGWTFVILRTEKGEKIFDGAVEAEVLRTKAVDEESFALTLLAKLSKKKRKNSPRN
ncbi:MAG: Coenzyme F420 hydrogenase/dehydrogenase, beta subunit C-terminal domain [Candidatus Bathyarchaeota archaeon]|nr:Coenzyme F420 hydrogenase/dehydrogenase, beta subunit C-terminal domain [Candidatus Bathyarchaeota archaeon]MDH5495266.1 Coenzyme F420 hydrogenase/dehydrogenase, beta subunit C-terminal domain [Candidatus Bathyarchaeota archaeon]